MCRESHRGAAGREAALLLFPAKRMLVSALPVIHCQSAQCCNARSRTQVLCRSLQPPQSQGQGGSVNAAALAAALSGIGSGSSAGRAGHMEKAPGPSLAEVLNPETIIPLMRQPGMLEQLSQYLPVSPRWILSYSLHSAPRLCMHPVCVDGREWAWHGRGTQVNVKHHAAAAYWHAVAALFTPSTEPPHPLQRL